MNIAFVICIQQMLYQYNSVEFKFFENIMIDACITHKIHRTMTYLFLLWALCFRQQITDNSTH